MENSRRRRLSQSFRRSRIRGFSLWPESKFINEASIGDVQGPVGDVAQSDTLARNLIGH